MPFLCLVVMLSKSPAVVIQHEKYIRPNPENLTTSHLRTTTQHPSNSNYPTQLKQLNLPNININNTCPSHPNIYSLPFAIGSARPLSPSHYGWGRVVWRGFASFIAKTPCQWESYDKKKLQLRYKQL